jgi:hypothetical protein
MPLYKTYGRWKNFDCIFGFSVKSYVRNTINLSWAKILMTSVICSHSIVKIHSGMALQKVKTRFSTVYKKTNKCSRKQWIFINAFSIFLPVMFRHMVAILKGSWVPAGVLYLVTWCLRTTSLETTRPSTILYRLLLNWTSLRRHEERPLKMAMWCRNM